VISNLGQRSIFCLFASAFSLLGCTSAEPAAESCTDLRLDANVLVHEYRLGDPTSGLGRLGQDGCLTEVADIVLPGNGMLLEAHGVPFFSDNDQGLLHALDVDKLAITSSFPIFVEGEIKSDRADLPNPHGVDRVTKDGQEELWVARYGLGSLAILKGNGQFDGTIDLSDLDPDGVPEMEAVRLEAGKAFVALELLDLSTFPAEAREPGIVAVVDLATREREALIHLSGRNPYGRFVPLDASASRLAIATPGSFDRIDASDGIDAIDLATRAVSQLISEDELGGSAYAVAFASETEGYAVVLGPEPGINPTKVVRFNPSDKSVETIATLESSAFVYTGLAVVGDLLLVADGTREAPRIVAVERNSRRVVASITPRLDAPWSFVPLAP